MTGEPIYLRLSSSYEEEHGPAIVSGTIDPNLNVHFVGMNDLDYAALWLGKLLAGKSEDEQQAILDELRARIAAAELTNRRAAEG